MLQPQPSRRRARPLLALAALLFLADASALAQIDLPRKRDQDKETPAGGEGDKKGGEAQDDKAKPEPKPREGRSIVPHLVCAVCGERNYTSARTRPTEAGFFTAWCGLCRQDRIHRASESSGSSADLDLPNRGAKPAAEARSEKAAPAAKELVLLPPPQASTADQRASAAHLYRQLDGVGLGSPLVEQAVESLIAMGEAGLVASRVALHEEDATRVLTAARVLLHGGGAEDAMRVVDRLHTRIPAELGTKLLKELLTRDPVHGSPTLLVELLDHPQARMRAAAQRELRDRLSPELLPLLARALESKRTDTRLEAVRLIADIDDPGVFDVLVEYLDDPAARVASEVVSAVAAIDEPRVPLELEARAFSGRWTLRENAYALLAIVEREDLTLQPILDDRHAEPLLRALEMTDPFIYGSCATALAGIGFRSDRPEDSGWLDREVTGRLVSVVSGKEFHPDFSALQPRALRRLKLVSGEDFGSDGPAWARWWIDNRGTFYARRVRISVAGERVTMLELHYRSTAEDPGVFSLFGPGADEAAVRARAGAGEVFRITADQCADLAALLEREGALGVERLPGNRGAKDARGRRIEVLVDGRGKAFGFPAGTGEPWFERVSSALRDLRDRNRWQRFPDLSAYSSERAFWEAEAPWWEEERDPLERALRLKSLVLTVAPVISPSQRTIVVDELERLYALEGVPSEQDFRPLVDLLRDEGFFVERARRMLALALRAAREVDGGAASLVPTDRARNLLDLLNARFGLEAADAMATIAVSCGREFPRELSEDRRPLLRAVAADALGRALVADKKTTADETLAEHEADREALIAMLADPEPMIEAACCLALGAAGFEEARTDLLVRARVGEAVVRAAALRAVARLGGDHVLEALVLGASAPDPLVRVAAAEGLAELRDPRTATVLVSMLGQGRESEVFEPARRGLLDLGEAAWPELARVANSSAAHARREATLLLAYQGVPRAAGAMIGLLNEDPLDAFVAEELAILSCIDMRDADDPAEQWDAWWRQVVHDDSRAWLRAAMERRGIAAPGPDALKGGGTLEGALFLLQVLERPEPWLAERGRRELEQLLAERLPDPPRGSAEREAWIAGLRERVGERWDS